MSHEKPGINAWFFALYERIERSECIMNKRQKRFADEYLIDLNITQAAVRAGYSEKTAYSIGQRLLKNVEVKSYIDEQLERIHNENIADTTEIMMYLTKVLRGKSSAEVLAMCGDGCQEVIEKAPDERERLKAAELLGKRYGMFKDAMSIEGVIPVVITDDLDEDDEEPPGEPEPPDSSG